MITIVHLEARDVLIKIKNQVDETQYFPIYGASQGYKSESLNNQSERVKNRLNGHFLSTYNDRLLYEKSILAKIYCL